MSKASIPQGTRDFSPEVMAKRKFILGHIERIYQSFGFMALETPAMENLSTLTGKYGNEGDQLIFKILNNGDYLKDIDVLNIDAKSLTPKIAEKGLRYDLTVPLARFVAMNRHAIQLPFKRYQIQPVWRADRPQKGRYREFWQCDADVLGTDSMLCESDFIQIYHMVFAALGIENYQIRINHRALLEAACEKANAADQFKAITVAIDKMDKIAWEGVEKELQSLGLDSSQCNILAQFLIKRPFNLATLETLNELLSGQTKAAKGLSDLQQILSFCNNTSDRVILDGSLARGLDYYTGCIFEVIINDVAIGSVSGGGRYDELTSVFGLKEAISGIGISFGIDRLYDAMEALQLFSGKTPAFTDVLFCPMEDNALPWCIELANELRQQQIKTEVYPQSSKLKKQLDYANAKGIKAAVLIGSNEINTKTLSVKNLITGEQMTCQANDLISIISQMP
ncbi:MAG: hypothetical protein RLZZ60_641 [Bacteroidota bacterium]|jgi:histidyl-tRNA synthetase